MWSMVELNFMRWQEIIGKLPADYMMFGNFERLFC
jgi:hypothetical protein